MQVFSVDIPLVEVVLVFAIIIFLIMVEAIIIIAILSKHLSKTKKLAELVEKMSEIILEIKQKEIEELNLLKRK